MIDLLVVFGSQTVMVRLSGENERECPWLAGPESPLTLSCVQGMDDVAVVFQVVGFVRSREKNCFDFVDMEAVSPSNGSLPPWT